MRRLSTLLFSVAMALSLSACDWFDSDRAGKVSFESADVTGAPYGKEFALTDHNGQPRTLADFKGKVVAIFFGYTQCPDVCPTTMVEMAQVMKELGPDADRVQVIFVTVDPERDTQALLAQYVPAFDARFLGMFGDAQATEKVVKEFKVFYQKVPSKANPDSYTVDHTAGTYVIDPQGNLRLFMKYGQSVESVTSDIRKLLQ
jgi:protein SCO1/2